MGRGRCLTRLAPWVDDSVFHGEESKFLGVRLNGFMKSHRFESQKTLLARIVVFLLLLAGMTAANLSTFALPLVHKNVPECHESQKHLPSPKPADHSCCAVGHQHALPTRVVSIQSAPTTLVFVFAFRSPLTFRACERQNAASLNPSPPAAPPLRI